MKKQIRTILTLTILTFITFSFTKTANQKEIKTEKSKVIWKGYKVTGSHEGTIEVKSGHLNFQDQQLIGGQVTMDMPTISSTDVKGLLKKKLDRHLKSEDFFGVEKHPTATLIFKEIKPLEENSYKVIGDITIKGKTSSITFNLSIVDNTANTHLKINRTKFDINYKSASFFENLKNKAIYDDFDLTVALAF